MIRRSLDITTAVLLGGCLLASLVVLTPALVVLRGLGEVER